MKQKRGRGLVSKGGKTREKVFEELREEKKEREEEEERRDKMRREEVRERRRRAAGVPRMNRSRNEREEALRICPLGSSLHSLPCVSLSRCLLTPVILQLVDRSPLGEG